MRGRGSYVFGTYVYRGGKYLTQVDSPFQVRQWLARDGTFLMTSQSQIATWKPGEQPKPVLDIVKEEAARKLSISGPGGMFAAMSPNGRRLAIFAEDAEFGVHDRTALWIADLGEDGHWHPKEIPIRVLPRRGDDVGVSEVNSLVWNGLGDELAVGIPGLPFPDATDDGAFTMCATVKFLPKGPRWSVWGLGAPVAWMDADHLLCESQKDNSLSVSPKILSRAHKTTRRCSEYGTEVAYDGERVYVAHVGFMNVFDRNLQKIGKMAVPDLPDERFRYPEPTTLVFVQKPVTSAPEAAHPGGGVEPGTPAPHPKSTSP